MSLIDVLCLLDAPSSAAEIGSRKGVAVASVVARLRQAWWAGLVEPEVDGRIAPTDLWSLTEAGRARLHGSPFSPALLGALRALLAREGGWVASGELAKWAVARGLKVSTLDAALRHLRAMGELEERSVKAGLWLISTEYRRAA